MPPQNLKTYSENEKILIFDSSSLISFAINGLYAELKNLKKNFKGKFIITKEVYNEIIGKPITTKRFELEAMKLNQLVEDKILESPSSIGVDEKKISEKTFELMNQANNTFVNEGVGIKLIDIGETSCIALSHILIEKNIKNVLVVDERTTRMLSENPENLKKIMEKRLHVKIEIKKPNLKSFEDLKIIRSAELIYVVFKKRMTDLKHKNALDALLYALKFNGCAISNEEIEEIKRLE